jgi:hypothetical protein
MPCEKGITEGNSFLLHLLWWRYFDFLILFVDIHLEKTYFSRKNSPLFQNKKMEKINVNPMYYVTRDNFSITNANIYKGTWSVSVVYLNEI